MFEREVVISRIRTCIEAVGNECHAMSDHYFWWERDICSRLVSLLLWEKPQLIYDFGNNIHQVTLVHQEYPARELPPLSTKPGEVAPDGSQLLKREFVEGIPLDIWQSKSKRQYIIAIPKSDLKGTVFGNKVASIEQAEQEFDRAKEKISSGRFRLPKDTKEKFDIVVFEPNEMKRITQQDIKYGADKIKITERKVLAAIEVEELYLLDWINDPLFQEAYQKLCANTGQGKQCEKGYMLVWLFTRQCGKLNFGKHKWRIEDVENSANSMRKKLENKDIHIYFATDRITDHPDFKPRWIEK